MKNKTIAALLFLNATAASAGSWTAGFSLGVADTGSYCDLFTEVTCDKDTAPSFKFYLGHDFNDYLRAEAFAVDLGTGRIEDNINTSDSGTVSVGGIGIAAMPMYPVTPRLDVFGKVGFIRTWIGEHRIERVGFMFRSDANNPLFGFGARYRMDNDVLLRLELESWRIQSRSDLDIETLTFGASLRF